MVIGKMLKEKRTENQLTQEQLSEKIFVSRKTISNWETGKTTPDIDSLIRLANLFDLSLNDLLLEGSEVVENIKKYSEIKRSRIYSAMSYTVTVSLIIISLFGDIRSWVSIIALVLSTILNLIVMVYFISRSDKLRGELLSSEKETDRNNNMIYNVIIILLALIAVSSIVYTMF